MSLNVRRTGVYAILQLTILAISSPASIAAEAGVWHIKAFHPEGRLLDVKAIDEDGNIYAVKAIQQAGDRHILDIKAFVDGDVRAVKVLDADDWFGPVKAVDQEGGILDIKALTADGDRLDVKAVGRAGHIFDIKAIGPDRQFYGVKAISPDGQVYDVKGVKLSEEPVEGELGGTKIRAHVKALPQVAH